MMSDIVLRVSVQEICAQEGVSETLVVEVVEHGIAEPLEGDSFSDWLFESSSVYWMKKAIRLHHDLEIDWISIAMVIDLLQQKDVLAKENQCLRNQLNRFLDDVRGA